MTPVAAARLAVSRGTGSLAVRGAGATGRVGHGAIGRDPGLDALRGIAVALVLVGHAGFRYAAPVGVTIFFVLSGYLITGILLERPPLRTFYRRRLARLAPALISVVAVVLVVSILRRDPETTAGALASLTYVSNWIIAAGVPLGAMEHTWSLSVEEQFYLFWPLAVLALSVTRLRPLLVVAIVAVVAARLATGMSPDGAEYRTTLRADALLLGCLLAVTAWRPSRSVVIAAVAIIAVLSVSTWPADGYTPAALAAVILVAAVRGHGAPRWLTGLGRISYGAYLWHLPLYLWLGAIVGLPVTLVVAAVSFRWFEEPLRRRLSGRAVAPDPDVEDVLAGEGALLPDVLEPRLVAVDEPRVAVLVAAAGDLGVDP